MKFIPRTNVLLLTILVAASTTSQLHADNAARSKLSFKDRPLISHLYTADPSAHVFDGRLYLYPSHDIDSGVKDRTDGNHYAMRDYHVFSMDRVGGPVTDHGVALELKDIPWAKRQLWAPDVAKKQGRYYLYFPAKDDQDVFHIGVASSDSPSGPFKAEARPIPGTYSMDPAVFEDSDHAYYLYFGGIQGGQLDRWPGGVYHAEGKAPAPGEPATAPRVARLTGDMTSLAEPVREISIIDQTGRPLLASDEQRRFFEGCWVHKHKNLYYLSYSTGGTHLLCYATGKSPYGPFTYRGILLLPVQGWTTHHSIVEFQGHWYLFYHDTELSGQNHLRNVKVCELSYDAEGNIRPISPFTEIGAW